MNETYVIQKETNEKIDTLEKMLSENFNPIFSPVKDVFWGGFYIRQVLMPKGEEGEEHVVTSMIHNTTHAYYVSKGEVSVVSENDGVQLIKAPYWGMTTPNTRRVLHIHEDTVWTTFHFTNIIPKDDSEEAKQEAVKKVANEILVPYENKLMNGHFLNNELILQKEINF